MLTKRFGEEFSDLSEEEAETVVHIIKEISQVLKFSKDPFDKTLSPRCKAILLIICSQLNFYCDYHWPRVAAQYEKSMGNILCMSLVLYFSTSLLTLDGEFSVSSSPLNSKKFNDPSLRIEPAPNDLDYHQLDLIRVGRFLGLSLDEFKFHPNFISRVETVYTAELRRVYITPIVEFNRTSIHQEVNLVSKRCDLAAGTALEPTPDSPRKKGKVDVLWTIEVKLASIKDMEPEEHSDIMKQIVACMCLSKTRIAYLLTPFDIQKVKFTGFDGDKICLAVTEYTGSKNIIRALLTTIETEDVWELSDKDVETLSKLLLRSESTNASPEDVSKSPNTSSEGLAGDNNEKGSKYSRTGGKDAHAGGAGSLATSKSVQKGGRSGFHYKGKQSVDDENAAPETKEEGQTGHAGGDEEEELIEHAGGDEEEELIEHAGGDEEEELIEHVGDEEEEQIEHAGGDEEEEEQIEHVGGEEEEEQIEHAGGDEEEEQIEHVGDEEEQIEHVGDEEEEQIEHVGDEEQEQNGRAGDEEQEQNGRAGDEEENQNGHAGVEEQEQNGRAGDEEENQNGHAGVDEQRISQIERDQEASSYFEKKLSLMGENGVSNFRVQVKKMAHKLRKKWNFPFISRLKRQRDSVKGNEDSFELRERTMPAQYQRVSHVNIQSQEREFNTF